MRFFAQEWEEAPLDLFEALNLVEMVMSAGSLPRSGLRHHAVTSKLDGFAALCVAVYSELHCHLTLNERAVVFG